MQVIAYLLIACIALAVLQAAAKVLLLAIGVTAVAALVKHPRETIAILGMCMAMEAFKAQPLAAVAIVSLCAFARRRKPPAERARKSCERINESLDAS